MKIVGIITICEWRSATIFSWLTELDSPQARHKFKMTVADNGGFLRVSACGVLWQKRLISVFY
ncbi:hypothetical protein [uncultured Pseudomonas sp.]|uniref:hypothetical protein n=1 Tax=uncultured Pseudomonas sp. TaxID=114707 RepID=UPI00261E6B61|nr:hypothetical protein [uncultured Pseudomonas sp.]